ncbi:MAG: hypothetical protein KDH20_11695 [Rhodocyclaceae bacterium]|nr:hypothetical protein [Rhodocyclaceae bacterium]
MKHALALATLAITSGVTMAGISATKHNLSSTQPDATNNQVTDTAEICVFCHTPHGANTGVTAPLWNKNLPSASQYSVYSTANSSTIDGQTLTVGSVSAACLSCHDGTQAMDSMVNEPGSGADTIASFTWTGTRQTNGQLNGTTIANLGADLTNDHPIGIQYCGGGYTDDGSGASTGSCTDTDFKAPVNDTINGSLVWWVDTTVGTASQREKTDMILYSRDFDQDDGAGGTIARKGPSVECASCHDPHVEAKDTTEVAFLRVSQSGSGVCLACHTK